MSKPSINIGLPDRVVILRGLWKMTEVCKEHQAVDHGQTDYELIQEITEACNKCPINDICKATSNAPSELANLDVIGKMFYEAVKEM